MRLAAYEDAIYSRDADGLSCERSFPLFLFELAGDPAVDELVVLGRVDPDARPAHYRPRPGARFVALPHYASLTAPGAVLRAIPRTLRRFWSVLGEVDAIWVCGPQPVAVLVVLLALARRRRVVLGVRQDTDEYARNRFPGRRLPQLALLALERVWRGLARLAPVAVVGPDLARRYAGATAVHELAVSFAREGDLAGPEVLAARDYGGEVTLLSVGRLDPEKNPVMLADVLAELVRGGGEWRMQVVGEGSLAGELEARLVELGVRQRADLLGYVPLDGGLADRYRDAGLLVHVSWTEGLPQVLLEAFGHRLPVAATAVGGVPAVAEGAAVLVEPGDPQAMAAALRRLAAEPDLRERLTETGMARVRERTLEAERARLVAFVAGS